MESRGLRVPLSPNEELTLRRVAIRMWESELPATALARLRCLGLIGDDKCLTPNGVVRYAALPHPKKATEQRLATFGAIMKKRSDG
jgi:hypothetical protein